MTSRLARLFFAVLCSSAILRAQTAAPAAAAATPAVEAAKPDEDQMLQKLQLPDADIDTVLNTLEMLTGRVVLRPAQLPTATYNLKILKPILKSEAILMIETVLALNGVGVAPQGDKALVITQLALTKSTAPEMITGSAFDQPPSGKPAVKIFQLEFLRVQEFAGMISQIVNPNYGQPVQLPNANAMLVTDSVSNLQRIETLLTQLDKPFLGGLKPKFYPLKFTKASDVVSKMRTVLQPLQLQLGQTTTYSADDGGAQIIVVTDPRQYELFDDLIAKLDVKSNPFTKNDVIYLKHADAKEVATLLTTIVTGQTGAAQRANSQSLRPGQGVANLPMPAAPVIPGQPAPLPTPATTPIAQAIDSVLGSGSNEFSSFLTVTPDIRSNAIVVSGTPDDLRLIDNIVTKLDIILAQVRIEIVLAEVTLDDNHSSGISQLGITVAGDRVTGFVGTEASTSITNGTVAYRGTAGVSGPFDLAGTLTINTTPRKSNSAILSVPSITTTHNKEAKFFFGETRPVVSGSTATPTAAATTTGFSTNSQIQQQPIGTTITVKPLIGNDGSVQLDIKMDITEVTGTVQIDNNAQYIIGQRTTNSFITAKTGEILYLSGIQKKKDSKSSSRLGPIPILGDIFGSRNRDNQRTELIFFFRPTVLTNTPTDNATAFERIKDLEQRDAVMKEVDPKYQPEKKPFFHLTKP